MKYGGYEYFKKFYSDLVGPEKAAKWKTSLYLTASASAELIADVALCPFEAVKVRTQTTIPPDIRGTFTGLANVISKEGYGGYVTIPYSQAILTKPVCTRVCTPSGAAKSPTP